MTLQEIVESVRKRITQGPGGEFSQAAKIAYGDRRLIDSRTVMLYLWVAGTVCVVAGCAGGWLAHSIWESLSGW